MPKTFTASKVSWIGIIVCGRSCGRWCTPSKVTWIGIISVSVSVGNTAQRSQIGARCVGLGVRMKCFLSLVLNDWAQLLWSWVNPWFWWLSEVVYSSLLQSLVDMNVYRRPSCRQWFGTSQDDCAVIDAGRVEVVGPPAGQGGLVLLCARLSVYLRYDDFEGYPIPDLWWELWYP